MRRFRCYGINSFLIFYYFELTFPVLCTTKSARKWTIYRETINRVNSNSYFFDFELTFQFKIAPALLPGAPLALYSNRAACFSGAPLALGP